MPIKIIHGDITKVKADAIVNAANTRLKQGGGVCGAIFSAAGSEELQTECDSIGYCGVGSAVITGAYRLPAKYIIHTVGPVWQGGNSGEGELLRTCYLSSLELAFKYHCSSVAFPLISSGIFGYPEKQALRVAVSAIDDFLSKNDMTVILILYKEMA